MGDGVPLLVCKGLEVRRGMRTILNKVDLVVAEGEIVVLRGDNGCGKSTLLEAAAGIRMLRKGTISHKTPEGELAIIRNSHGHRGIAKPFGLTLQKLAMCGDELVQQRLQLSLKVGGFDPETTENKAVIATEMKKWGLLHRKNDRIAWLSGGLARRVSILVGLLPGIVAKKPTLILLDEPDSGLDESGKQILATELAALAEKGNGVLMATHDETISSTGTRKIYWQKNKPVLTEVGALQTEVKATGRGVMNQEQGGTHGKKRNPISQIIVNPFTMVEKKWISNLDKRTWASISSGGIAGLVALLLVLSFNLKMTDYSREWNTMLLFMPAMVIGLSLPPSIKWMEENGGMDWWDAHSAGKSPTGIAMQQVYIGGIITIIAAVMLKYSWETSPIGGYNVVIFALLGCFGGLLVMMNNVILIAQRRLVNALQRSNALLFNLFLPLLIYPFILFCNGVANFLSKEDMVFAELANTLAAISLFLCIFLALRLLKPQ